jgi:hypothetical protein
VKTSSTTSFGLAAILVCCAGITLAACGTEEEVFADVSSDVASDADASEDADGTGSDSGTDTTVRCEGVDPSITCLDTGCPDDQQCLPIDADQCVPSSCTCGDDGQWACTADCGQPYACSDASELCPTEPPIGESCPRNELECSWGTECCCGQCFPSTVCTCSGDSWACYATDACMIPSCEGQTCVTDDDCEGGAGVDLRCTDGVCGGDNRARCADFDSTQCESVSSVHCEWVEPAGCVTESGPAILGEAGCFPYGGCADDTECPAGYFCETEIQANPRCAWEEPLCDSCREVRSLCVPRGV